MEINEFALYSQIIGSLAVVIALLIGAQQIIEHRKQKKLEYIWNMFKELDDDITHEARDNIYINSHHFIGTENEIQNRITEIPKELVKQASIVSSSFDRIGYFVHHKLIPQKLILDNFASSLARSWLILENYIKVLRKTKYHKDHECFFEQLSIAALNLYIKKTDVEKQLLCWRNDE